MRPPPFTLTLLLATLSTHGQQAPAITADAIMVRVAANQDAAEIARARFLYIQHAHIASRKGKTVRCEETTDYRVTPTATGSGRQLLKLEGHLLQKGKYVTYTSLPSEHQTPAAEKPGTPAATPPGPLPETSTQPKGDDLDISVNTGDDSMDRDLVENMRKNLTAGHSKDGISANLFPLTSKEQASYRFTLLGREPRNGRDSFHIAFAPKDPDDFAWKGDAWIDATAFQPIVVRTAMSRKIPLAVRMLLGTNVPGLGFTIVYAPQTAIKPDLPAAIHSPDGPADQPPLWFPTSFGTEFKIHVLFFFNREIVFSAENHDFQQTHTTAKILEAPAN